MRISDQEPSSIKDLGELVSETLGENEVYSVAVEALIFNANKEWVLMHRGSKARDEVDKLEGIGGRYEGDGSFRDELFREIVEEVGSKAKIEIVCFNEIKHDVVKFNNQGDLVNKNWIIISFICGLKSGALEIMEPEKCVGFVRVKGLDVNPQRLTSSAQKSLSTLQEKWENISPKLDVFFANAKIN